MKLKIIGSNSNGNCYVIENNEEALIIEAGVQFTKIKKVLNFNLSKVKGCLISHCHSDHAKSAKEIASSGINIYTLKETSDTFSFSSHRIINVIPENIYQIGGFKVIPFLLKHDVPIIGFFINHKETGNVAFITDTIYCPVKFKNLNHIMIEANYCQTILDRRLAAGTNPKFLRDRVIQSHMSLATCKEALKANDLSRVNNIVLIHLSDGNSDAKRFQKEVQEVTGKIVFVAEAGMVIENFNKTAF